MSVRGLKRSIPRNRIELEGGERRDGENERAPAKEEASKDMYVLMRACVSLQKICRTSRRRQIRD